MIINVCEWLLVNTNDYQWLLMLIHGYPWLLFVINDGTLALIDYAYKNKQFSF